MARQFIGLLRTMALDSDGAVVLTAHPSLSGMSSGTGLSGSTAWHNAVRSRLYLTRPKVDEGEEVDDFERVLSGKKANYAAGGSGTTSLRWDKGVFVSQASETGIFRTIERNRDRIVVMHEGSIQQNDDPIAIYDKPVNRFVAGFIGSPPMNFMNGKIRNMNGSFYFDEGNFKVKLLETMNEKVAPYRDREVVFGIRPEDIYDKLSVTEVSEDNTVAATVEVSEPMGAETYLHMTTGKHLFTARFPAQERAEPNQDIQVVFDVSKAHFFDCKTDVAIV